LGVAEAYVPVGSYRLRLATTRGLTVGDTVLIEHPSTKEWIAAVGMDRFPSRDRGSYLDWRPGTLDLCWDRVVRQIDRDAITLDAPLTTALDAAHGRCRVRGYSWPGRVRNAGVENLRCESEYDRANTHDEQHAWTAVGVENAEDVWVRQVTAAHFAGSAVALWEACQRGPGGDCMAVEPVCGVRRHRP